MELQQLAQAGNVQIVCSVQDLIAFANQVAHRIIMANKESATEKQPEKEDKLYTKREVAKILQVTDATLWRWEKAEYLVPTRIGNKVYYTQEALNSVKRIAQQQ